LRTLHTRILHKSSNNHLLGSIILHGTCKLVLLRPFGLVTRRASLLAGAVLAAAAILRNNAQTKPFLALLQHDVQSCGE
jgi:hypothetical protein